MRQSAPIGIFLAIAAASTVLLSGCSTTDGQAVSATTSGSAAGSGTAAADAGECESVAGELVELKQYSADEPIVKLPVPDGWQRMTQMDSELIRGALVNPDLTDRAFAPTIVLSFEDATGKVETPKDLLRAQADSMKMMGGSASSLKFGTTCGFPSMTADVDLPAQGQIAPRTGSMLAIAVEAGEDLYGITMVAQTTDESKAEYEDAVETVFSGIQVIPAAAGA